MTTTTEWTGDIPEVVALRAEIDLLHRQVDTMVLQLKEARQNSDPYTEGYILARIDALREILTRLWVAA